MLSSSQDKADFEREFIFEPCPVCGRNFGSENVFCSAKCEKEAHQLRKFIRAYFQRMCRLGFSIRFADGYFPLVHVPVYMEKFFPYGCTSFMLFPAGVRPLNSDFMADIEREVEHMIGSYAWQFIENKRDNPIESEWELQKRFERYCQDGINNQSGLVICPHCSGKYLSSGLYDESLCSTEFRCSTTNHPF